MRPMIMLASGEFMSAYYAETCRKEWLDAGANWRRAKREARKVFRGSWRDYQAARLERMAGIYPPPAGLSIDHSALSWWRNHHA